MRSSQVSETEALIHGMGKGLAGLEVRIDSPFPCETVEAFGARVAREVQEAGRVPVLTLGFGLRQVLPALEAALSGVGTEGWGPVQLVEGNGCYGELIVGLQTFHVDTSVPVHQLMVRGRCVGAVVQDEDARHCFLAGLGASEPVGDFAKQAAVGLGELKSVLAEAGMDLADVVRTWFYNRTILEWYGDFNRVRNDVYRACEFVLGATPASTAVAGENTSGAAFQLAAWAVKPRAKGLELSSVPSPLQCPAPAYGSAFSRAVELRVGAERRMLVSGTASIEPGGLTVHQGDTEAQIRHTLLVVDALLKSRGYRWDDCDRAIAYFKRAQDVVLLPACLSVYGVTQLPVLAVNCDICRDDLLFELELDVKTEGPQGSCL